MLAEPREGGWADLRGPEPRPLPALSRDGAGSAHPGWARGLAGSGDGAPGGFVVGGTVCTLLRRRAFSYLLGSKWNQNQKETAFFFFSFNLRRGPLK